MDLNLDLNNDQNFNDYNTNVSTIENNITIEILNKKTNCKYDLIITQESEYWIKYNKFFENFSDLFNLLKNSFNKQKWSVISETSEEIYIDFIIEGVFGFNLVLIIPKEKEENAYLYRYIKLLEEKINNMEERLKDLENN